MKTKILDLYQAFLAPFRGINKEIWLLSFVSLINRSGAMVLCFLALYLTSYLHFSIEDSGFIMSFYGLGTIAGALLGGRWTDRYGYYRVQLFTMIASGVFLLATLWITSFWGLCAILFMTSLAADAFRPANSIAIKTHSNNENRTRAFSILRVAVNLACSIALILGGYFSTIGWAWLFWADSLTCFAAAVMIFTFIREKKSIQTTDNQLIKENIKTEIKNTKSAYTDSNYWIFVTTTFLGAMVFMQIIWTVPTFFKEIYHWDGYMIGLVAAVNGITVMVIELPIVFRIQDKKTPLHWVRWGFIVYGLSYMFFWLPTQHSFWWAICYMISISLGEIFVMPFSATFVTKRGDGPRQGEYMGMYGLAYSFSNVLAPLVGTQMIARFGFDALWLLLVGFSTIAWLLLDKIEE